MTVANKARAGIKWGVLGGILNQLFSWVATIWVIRLLTPEDFALIALSDLALGVLLVIGQFGIGAALVRTINLTKKQTNQSFTALLIVNVILFSFFQLSAPFFADLFEQPRLLGLIRLSSIAFLLLPFNVINGALINRDMQYKQLHILNVGIGILQIMINLSLAMLGYGFWALAIGAIVAQCTSAICYSWLTQYSPRLDFSFDEFKPLVRDSSLNFFHSTACEINQRVDIFFINHFTGSNALGLYRVILSLSEKPVSMIGGLAQQIGLASFSKISEDKSLVGHYVVKSTAVMAMLLFPVFFGLAATAPNFVPLLLGDRWLSAIIPLQIICIVQLVNAFKVIPGSALFATGFGKRKLLHVTVAFFAAIVGWGLGLPFGLNVGCMLFATTYVVWFIWHIWDASHYILLKQKEYWRCLLIPMSLSVFMFFIVVGINDIMQNLPVLAVLAVQICVGAFVYIALALMCFKNHSLNLFKLLKNS